MSIHVKVFVCTSSKKPVKNAEIRRWAVDSYSHLQENIESAFNTEDAVSLDNVVIQYNDTNDWITIRSEEEFHDSVRVMKEQKKKALRLRVGSSALVSKIATNNKSIGFGKRGRIGKGPRMPPRYPPVDGDGKIKGPLPSLPHRHNRPPICPH
mmetsp:Transcript_5610/g.21104  ORF Transcript_5610/g.21104 Transcript_5610/m.21104 type:complete len:153 (-) Transcript_5610:1504-1962(-)